MRESGRVLRGPSFIVAPDRLLDLVLFEGRGWFRLGYSSSPIDFIIVGNFRIERPFHSWSEEPGCVQTCCGPGPRTSASGRRSDRSLDLTPITSPGSPVRVCVPRGNTNAPGIDLRLSRADGTAEGAVRVLI